MEDNTMNESERFAQKQKIPDTHFMWYLISLKMFDFKDKNKNTKLPVESEVWLQFFGTISWSDCLACESQSMKVAVNYVLRSNTIRWLSHGSSIRIVGHMTKTPKNWQTHTVQIDWVSSLVFSVSRMQINWLCGISCLAPSFYRIALILSLAKCKANTDDSSRWVLVVCVQRPSASQLITNELDRMKLVERKSSLVHGFRVYNIIFISQKLVT